VDSANELRLHPGAGPCIRSGWCCKQAPCPFGEGKPCNHLVEIGGGRYECGIADWIVTQPGWEEAPAFGAGCCSSLNPDRARLLGKTEEQVWIEFFASKINKD
jgi:hypothetical protein